MDAQKLTQILTDHLEWITSGGARGTRAYLSRADLSRADLSRADLSRANLSGADLSGADLSGADLSGAYLSRADLSRANLSGADLSRAYLSRADLSGAKNIPEAARLSTQIVPEEGAFTGFKKLADGLVAILAVPARAKRSNATGRKCRVSEARIKAIYHPARPDVALTEGRSKHDPAFVYRVGETARPAEPFDENRWNECGSGIHLFITRAEAEAYE